MEAAYFLCRPTDRTKGVYLSRVHRQFIRIALALERYEIEYGLLPLPVVEKDSNNKSKQTIPRAEDFAVDSENLSIADVRDPFNPELYIGYYAKGEIYILYSCGPDKDYDIDPNAIVGLTVSYYSDQSTVEKIYDPTNGLISNGDVFDVYALD